MNKLYLITAFVFSFCVLTACSSHKKITKEINYIIYGVYCGECTHNCVVMYKLDGTTLLRDTTELFFQNAANLEHAKGEQLNSKEFKEAQILVTSLPSMLLKSENTSFGHPDKSDQCGIYLQIMVGDKLKTSFIDTETESIPLELRNYAKQIMRLSKFKPL